LNGLNQAASNEPEYTAFLIACAVPETPQRVEYGDSLTAFVWSTAKAKRNQASALHTLRDSGDLNRHSKKAVRERSSLIYSNSEA
jgi:hypothetical protein